MKCHLIFLPQYVLILLFLFQFYVSSFWLISTLLLLSKYIDFPLSFYICVIHVGLQVGVTCVVVFAFLFWCHILDLFNKLTYHYTWQSGAWSFWAFLSLSLSLSKLYITFFRFFCQALFEVFFFFFLIRYCSNNMGNINQTLLRVNSHFLNIGSRLTAKIIQLL